MLRGLYTAASAMNANNKKMDIITNNIANINTVGYKKDFVLSETFPEVLINKIHTPFDFSDREGFKGVAVKQEGKTYNINTSGGFFRTKTPNGISHNTCVNLTINKQGYLSTYDTDVRGKMDTEGGYLVLGNRGPVYVGEGEVEINERGQVLVDGNIIDNLVMHVPLRAIGTLNGGVRLDRIETNYRQGQLYETGNPLDVALKGEGFFSVETPEGIRLTRDGSFQLDSNHQLVTSEGYRVMGSKGAMIIDETPITLSEKGEILSDGKVIHQLHIINVENLKDLRKVGNNIYQIVEGAEVQEKPFEGQVLQGFLENANVDPIKEMVEMITLFRNYESNQRILKAYDDTLAKVVNEIGKI
jgi:flagellar basal-body rod protein FlgF